MSRRIVELNGDDWRLGQAPANAVPERAAWQELKEVAEWLPARVPGNVRADLVRAGQLPDLAFATGPEAAQWADGYCWWLVREFPHPASAGDRVHLILRGVDYINDLFLNGKYLGRHEGMFSPQVRDVTDLLGSQNHLAVRLLGSSLLPCDRSSPWEKLWNRIEATLGNMPGRFPHRRDTLKCQMSFGWDFAPSLRTMGIWDDVYLIASKEIFIEDIAIEQQVAQSSASISAEVQLNSLRGGRARLRLVMAGENFDSDPLIAEQPVDLAPGSIRYKLRLVIPTPRLWWPWDHGHPDLYRLTVEVWDGDRRLDASGLTVGLRKVELDGWTLKVNGRRVYARGANWVPADILPGRVTSADYEALLALARRANMNLLRVWGGGLREKRAFYDLCDRLGILVWQEFPFACAFLTRFPRSPGYLQLVQSEARAIVRDLRNHACLAIWCGGNEFSPKRNQGLVAALRQVLESTDPTRPFLPASPSDGDSHSWQVWHDRYPPSHFCRDEAAFASEFGLQAPPEATALRQFIPDGDLWPPGPSWAYHGAGFAKLKRYAQPYLTEGDPSLENFIQASQCAQSHGLQIAIEHYRRRKAQGCGGVLIWQLNEPWPAISWSLLDFHRQPKPAYETVSRLFKPVLVSVKFPLRNYQSGEQFRANVWIISDRADVLANCRLEINLWDCDGQPAERTEMTVDVEPDSARVVGGLDWQLPTGGGWHLTCRLSHDGRTVSHNEYDLAIHDDLRPNLRQRLWVELRSLVIPD